MSVSLCLMVRNEEEKLAACLQSAADLVDETVVVDTGSTDGTHELAARFGARVFEFPWVDDFAAARNECIRQATGDFIIWMDADERIDAANREKLKALFDHLRGVSSQSSAVSSQKVEDRGQSSEVKGQNAGGDELLATDNGLLTNVAYVMNCWSVGKDAPNTGTVVQHVRLFPNRPEIRWKYRVHEQILPALRAANANVLFTDIIIQHTGYVDPAFTRQKLERNLRLLHLDHVDHPNDPYILFHLGWGHLELNRVPEAISFLRASLDGSQPGDSIVKKLFALLAQAHHRLGQRNEALAACRSGRARYPEDPELLYLESILHRERREWSLAEKSLRKLAGSHSVMSTNGKGQFSSADVGLISYLTRHQLALVFYQQGRWAEAETEWKLALADRPGYLDALKGLGEIYLKQGQWPELQGVVEILKEKKTSNHESFELDEYEGRMLDARGMLARKEFDTARSVLEPIAAAQPGALYPRIILSHVYLQEGKDIQAAERVLREVVQLEPAQAECWRNLVVLFRQQGRLDEAVEACRAGWRSCLRYPTLPLLLGITLADKSNFAAAEMCFLRLLELPFDGPMPNEHVEARNQLALIYQKTGHPAEAEAQWRTLLAERPDYGPAIQALRNPESGVGNQESEARGHKSEPNDQLLTSHHSLTQHSPNQDLASIIILCCNQLEYTRRCVESLLNCTLHPFELIFVDNGSTDGTSEYLHKISKGIDQVSVPFSRPARIEVIVNETNRGYPAGCNQALARSAGQFLVFLNNDTIVTQGWLENLVAHAEKDRLVGLVGPVTNCASGPQQIPVDYQDLDSLPAFATRLRQEKAGRSYAVDRLTGFCLLACREVIEQIGNFDEQFGLGFFDDDDLCVRAREASFGLLVAEDVFVHHFGNRTFHSLGVDCKKLLVSNFERFKTKWGNDKAVGYHLPGDEK